LTIIPSVSKELFDMWHKPVSAVKRIVYGRRGEPYHFSGATVRFVPGTRPVRSRYATSNNAVNRYDALQIIWLDQHLKEGDTVIDVGAHCGGISALMAAKCGQTGKVVSFEPDPYPRAMLLRTFALNPGLKMPTVEPVGCWDVDGEATLYSDRGNARSALALLVADVPEKLTVPTVTLDSYLSAHTLEPQCVKIDAEGAEIRILKGATRLLAGKAEILCELHPTAWPDFGNSLGELKSLLSAAGRRIQYLDEKTDLEEPAKYGVALLSPVN
jgi:FkbM family methyltransferase